MLVAAEGSQRRAAEALGVLPTTLHAKLRRHGLDATYRSLRAQAAKGRSPDARPHGPEPADAASREEAEPAHVDPSRAH